MFFAQSGSTKRDLWTLNVIFKEVAPPSMFYGHNYIELYCVGMASSASRCYRKGQFCDQQFTKFNDTECLYDREPERGPVTS